VYAADVKLFTKSKNPITIPLKSGVFLNLQKAKVAMILKIWCSYNADFSVFSGYFTETIKNMKIYRISRTQNSANRQRTCRSLSFDFIEL
jgi:hypothetical protein